MSVKKLTQKSLNLLKSKFVDGQEYILMDKSGDREVWLPAPRKEIPSCFRCGYIGPALDQHHIHGRKNSDETIYLCSNCHRELHAGEWSL